MKDKKNNIFKRVARSANTYLIFAVVFLIFGLATIAVGPKFYHEGYIYFPHLFMFAIVVACFNRWHELKYKKYYVTSFHDDHISVRLYPKGKNKIIRDKDIIAIDNKGSEIEFVLKSNEKLTICVLNLLYNDRKKLTDYFEAIEKNLKPGSTLSSDV